MTEELTWLPAWRISELIAKREVSAVEVTQHFLGRIEELNPKLHAFDVVDSAGALEQARRAEAAVLAGEQIGPLHGVPTAVLNTYKVKGLPSKTWNLDTATNETIGIERLRRAGMVVVGSTETYFFDADRWPRNPWDLRKEPGNSSRGSAVAASAALLPITVGGDGAGSIRLPAAFSGVVGVHLSRGLVPHVDYDRRSLQLVTSIGPMARNVRDCATMTQIMAGPDGRDLVCIQDDPRDYLARIDDGVEGLRLAWTDDFGWANVHAVEETPRVIKVARATAMGLRALGATVDDSQEAWEPHPLPAPVLGGTVFGSVDVHPPGLGEKVAKRMLEFDAAGREVGIPPSLEPPQISAADYQAATESRARNWDRCRRVLTEHDVLLSATTPMVTRPIEEWGVYNPIPTYPAHTEMFNTLGFPAASVPCGFLDGMPIGLQIAARPGREDLIFRVANAVQKAFSHDERPAMI